MLILPITDLDGEIRRATVAAFATMVGSWETGSARAFTPQHERKYTGGFDFDKSYFELRNYIHAFYSNFNAVHQELPVVTVYAVAALTFIGSRKNGGMEEKFPGTDPVLFRKFQEEILIPSRESKKVLPPLDDSLEEIGWATP